MVEKIRDEEAKIRKEAVKEAKEKTSKKEKTQIAKELKRCNVDIDIIVKSTGLSKEEVEGLK